MYKVIIETESEFHYYKISIPSKKVAFKYADCKRIYLENRGDKVLKISIAEDVTEEIKP